MSHAPRHHLSRARFGRSLRSALGVCTLTLLASLTGCGAEYSVVGGECAAGYAQCGLACVDLANDPENCGGCGVMCSDGVCLDGVCGKSADSGRNVAQGDSALDVRNNPRDVTSGDGAGKDRATTDQGSPDSGAADARPGDGPLSTDGQAGAEVASEAQGDQGPLPGDGSLDSFSDATGNDVVCPSPDWNCGGVCVDEATDPDNCGGCLVFCPSGICTGGMCGGMTEGDIVVIGQDYKSIRSTLTAPKPLSNSVFLPTTDPVRVLSFEHYADPTSVANVKSILSSEASRTGRNVNYTVSSNDGDIPSMLTNVSFDVLLVYDQEAAAAGVLGPLGSSWAATLASFTSVGGVVVSLDGAAGPTKEMPAFDTQAGLVAISQHVVVPTGSSLLVAAPADAIGHGVSSPYVAEPNCVSFVTSEPDGGSLTFVVEETISETGRPVVIHRAVP